MKITVVFSKHALLKLSQRGLEKKRILETVMHPDFIEPSYNFREARYRLYTKNHLKVVVKVEGSKILVVTAHWIAKHRAE